MSVTYKDIDDLSQKSSVAGTEKIPVSDTEYITPTQIAGLAGSAGTLDTTATTSQTTSASESLSGSVTLHKVSKTGNYYDLTYKPWQRGGTDDYSLYWGSDSVVNGYHSLAEGYKCETGGSSTSNTKTANQSNVVGTCSHAEGNATIAKGLSCHSEGKKTFASGEGSHAEGIETEAKGIASHSEGEHTQANNKGEHAGGRYNKSTQTSSTYGNAGNTTHSIGIGTGTSDRKNAVEVMENGDVYVKGVGSYDGTNYSSASTLQTVVNGATPNDSTITIQMNGSTVDSFTTNASSAKTINLGTVITSHQSLSSVVSKSGDTMADDATLTFADSGSLYTNEISPNSIVLTDSDDDFGITIDVLEPQIVVDGGGGDSTTIKPGVIKNGSVVVNLPTSAGTLALASQIPSILSGTSDPASNLGSNGDIYIKLSS